MSPAHAIPTMLGHPGSQASGVGPKNSFSLYNRLKPVQVVERESAIKNANDPIPLPGSDEELNDCMTQQQKNIF